MKRVIIFLAITSSLFFTSFTFAGEQYLCVADKATGFSYNKSTKNWEHTRFKTNKKYVISKPEDGSTAFVVRQMGESFYWVSCKNDFNVLGSLFCGGSFSENFRFNRKYGRFLISYTIGYINGIDSDDDAPYIEIGKCSKF